MRVVSDSPPQCGSADRLSPIGWTVAAHKLLSQPPGQPKKHIGLRVVSDILPTDQASFTKFLSEVVAWMARRRARTRMMLPSTAAHGNPYAIDATAPAVLHAAMRIMQARFLWNINPSAGTQTKRQLQAILRWRPLCAGSVLRV